MGSRPETSSNVQHVKKVLFDSAMKEDWEEVINIYEHHPKLHQVKISRSGDTALHIAVLVGEEDIVEKLVEIISKTAEQEETLKVGNDRGDTPLHLAAAMGSVRICERIANKHPELIGARNCDQETPFSVAVLNGKKDTFLCLQYIIGKEKGSHYCRGKDGDTLLNIAISGDHFDLAFQIIYLYPQLVYCVNQHGLTPLHVLASKPSAFKSRSRLRWYREIIYICTFVGVPRVQKTDKWGKVPIFPENYQACIDFFRLFREMFFSLLHKTSDPIDTESQVQGYHQMLPPNYCTCFEFIKLPFHAMLLILGFGFKEISKVQEQKERHEWSILLMNVLLERYKPFEYQNNGQKPQGQEDIDIPSEANENDIIDTDIPSEANENCIIDTDIPSEANENAAAIHHKNSDDKEETAILIAAKNGNSEMVEKILQLFPVAMHDVNSDDKNVVLLAVENRQPHVYSLLLEKKSMKDYIFRKVDKDGNSALHLAASLGDYRRWKIPGAALQMQWEIKWYEYVKNSMPRDSLARYNKKGETPNDIFKETHKDLVKDGGKWLTSTSESCSVVAALVATVAFTNSTTVPGGIKETNGKPNLANEPAFEIFAISSLVSLCFSVTSLVMFLSILTSRRQEKDFGKNLPRRLLVGLTSLFVSIASVLVSFCAGHFFVLKDKLKHAAFPVYAATCLPVTFFATGQFTLYLDLIRGTFTKVPQRSSVTS